MTKRCNKCGQQNSDWAKECGRCEEALSDRADKLVLFPVQYHHKIRNQAVAPKGVPWEWIEQFRTRIERNHGQTLERLSQRGGLGVGEIWCAAHDRRATERMPVSKDSAFLWLNDRMSEWKQNARVSLSEAIG